MIGVIALLILIGGLMWLAGLGGGDDQVGEGKRFETEEEYQQWKNSPHAAHNKVSDHNRTKTFIHKGLGGKGKKK